MGDLTEIPATTTSAKKAKQQGRAESSFVKVRAYQRTAPPPKMVKAAKLVVENGGKDKPLSKGEIMAQAGYSAAIQKTPNKITDSPTFQDLLEQYMPNDNLAKVHQRLLNTRKIEHMVFPLGPVGEDDDNLSGANPNEANPMDDLTYPVERTTLTDQEIKDMLAEVNCVVKRIVHGQTARHVYFWAHDAKAQAGALELAYKMKGLLGSGDGNKGGGGINFNFGSQTFVKTGGDNS